jgi:proteasome lid subunit RPN8/RPN11
MATGISILSCSNMLQSLLRTSLLRGGGFFMKKFELPTNIRQIGTMGEGLKVYVEDYVCSYLRQYAESEAPAEKVAFLVGKYMVIDNAPYVFVSGAILGKHSMFQDNMESFTADSFDYAEEQLAKFFPGNEIVGWMQSQPGYGVYLNPSYADYHMSNFTRPYNLLYVMDPAEKLNMFYGWNKEMSGIDEIPGYLVYYDQNKGMQDYMTNNRISRRKAPLPEDEAELAARLRTINGPKKTESPAETHVRESTATRGRPPMGGYKTTPAGSGLGSLGGDRFGEKKAGRSIEDMRRLSNLLVGLCAVLFITSFILGAGLLQSDGRISALESAIVTMDSNNLIIADQIRQLVAADPVFAPGDNIPGDLTAAGDLADATDATADASQTPTPPTENLTPPPQPPIETPSPPPQTEAPTEPPETTPPPPETTPAMSLANVPESYTIQPGDSLLQISRMFFGDANMVDRIMELNNIEDPNHIVIGQTLILPRY